MGAGLIGCGAQGAGRPGDRTVTITQLFTWLVFLPLNDGLGVYNRYYIRLSDGRVKVLGISARRHDTPDYIRMMQGDMLTIMGRAATIAERDGLWDEVNAIYRNAVERLPSTPAREMTLNRWISRLTYTSRCIEGAAVNAYRKWEVPVAPCMKIPYLVRDARTYHVNPIRNVYQFDLAYYRELLERAWTEIAYAFNTGRGSGKEQHRYPPNEVQR